MTVRELVLQKKMNISVKDFFNKCYQINFFLWIRSDLQNKSLLKNLIYYAVLLSWKVKLWTNTLAYLKAHSQVWDNFANWKPFKNDEKCFYFTLRAFLFSKYLSFCLDFLVMKKNSLIRKIKLISKFMTSQSGKQTIAIHILPNTSRSKGSHTMEFGQFIEYNIGNIFLEKILHKEWWRNYFQIFF